MSKFLYNPNVAAVVLADVILGQRKPGQGRIFSYDHDSAPFREGMHLFKRSTFLTSNVRWTAQ